MSAFCDICITGKILELNEWSESHVSGGGGGGNGYATVINEVKTTIVRRKKIWIELDDGEQREIEFKDSGFSARVGHRVTFYGLRAKRLSDAHLYHIALSYNHTTGVSCFDEKQLSAAVHGSLRGKFLFTLIVAVMAANIGTQWGANETHYIFGACLFGIPALVLYGIMFAIRHVSGHKMVNAAEARLSGMPRHSVVDDSVIVTGIRSPA